MDRMLRDVRVILLFVLPGLLLYAGIFLIPLVSTAVYSLSEWGGYGLPKFIGIANFRKLFTKDPLFWGAVGNTFQLVLFSIVGQVVPGVAFALLLNRYSRGVAVFKTIFFVPVILSTAAIALLWLKIYEPNFGIINSFFNAVGLERYSQDWLSNPRTALYAVFIPILWQYVGYHMIIQYAGLKSIPPQYYEAALIDGASGFQAVRYITLPLMLDVLKVSIVLAAVGSLRIFDHIYIMTKGGPFNSSLTVAIQMYNEAFLKLQFGYGSAVAVFLVAECLLVTYAINRLLTRDRLEF